MIKVYTLFFLILTRKISSTLSCSTIYVKSEKNLNDVNPCYVNNITQSLKISNDTINFLNIKIISLDIQTIYNIDEEITIANGNSTIEYYKIVLFL